MDYQDDRDHNGPPPHDGEEIGMELDEYTHIVREIELQPKWRHRADKEADYADGNQLDSDLLRRMQEIGIPPAVEDQIGPALRAIQGYEASTRTDWRVTPNGGLGGQDVADAINYRLNEAERMSKADKACSEAFRSQIGPGLGWVEVSRNPNPLDYKYRCTAVHRNEIHYDFHAKQDLTDARWLRRHRWLHPTRLASVFPQHRDLIMTLGKGGSAWWLTMPGAIDGGASTGLNGSWGDARGWTVSEDRWFNPWNKDLCLSEVWYRRWVMAVLIKTRDGRVVEYDQANPAHDLAIAQGLVEVFKASVPRVRRSFWVGPHRLFDGPSPYTHSHFPYVPFWGFREDSTGVPYGYIRSMIYQQDSINSASAKARWGMSVVRVERTKGAVDMTDAQLRRQIARPDADIVLDQAHMAKPGARFEVHRDFQLTDQQFQLMQDARTAIERVSGITSGFQGKKGTATSGVQEQTQVEQSNQSLGYIMDNFRSGRTIVGEMLMAMIIEDIGDQEHEVIIEGDAINDERVVVLNRRETDPVTNTPKISNDLMRTRLLVALEDVPSTSSFRGQQLNALSEAVKALPPQYQAAAMPFMAALMDVPFKRELTKALRDAGSQEAPEAVEKRVREEIANQLKARELDMRERLTDAQVKQIMAQAVQTGVQAAFSAMQGGSQVAQMPMIAPIADAIMQGAGYVRPAGGQDPNFPMPEAGTLPAGAVPEVQQNTSPTFPPVPSDGASPMQGIETPRTADNLPA
ncbi:hypothetical protein [Aquabacterium sp.]|uniref:portal protein n=1 Tax=Aquabacterium sp. TaxID=1872578 RepID=UPI00260ED075|nr:hypothetical protein [Aquabacterium sp.]MDD2978135.1 hypothetical protein [Aquabacterium sp.]